MMKQLLTISAAAVVAGGLSACTTLRVSSDVNQPLAATTKCQSFDWAGSFKGSSDALRSTIANPVNEARLRTAIEANLATAGVHQASENADCLVGYGIGQRNVVEGGYGGFGPGWGWGGGWGWGRGWGGGYWGGYGGWDYPYVYPEGVIGVDIYDGKSKQAIWHASVNQSLVGVTGDKADRRIKDAVAAIFTKYPH